MTTDVDNMSKKDRETLAPGVVLDSISIYDSLTGTQDESAAPGAIKLHPCPKLSYKGETRRRE